MLLQFSIQNFGVFKEKTVLSLVASNYDKSTREDDNVFSVKGFADLRYVKSAVIYGANASGKTMFINAMLFMRIFVIECVIDSQKNSSIAIEPFRLDDRSEKLPTEFEVIFIHNCVRYRYGFEVSKEKVISEWLYYKPKTKEVEVFYREENHFDVHGSIVPQVKMVVDNTLVRDNVLLVTVAAQFNDTISQNVMNWFKKFKFISGLKELGYKHVVIEKMKEDHYKLKILELLKVADLGIQDIKIKENNELLIKFPKEIRNRITKDITEGKMIFPPHVLTTRQKYNSNRKIIGQVDFLLSRNESKGTGKLFYLAGIILDVIENGYILAVDELDSNLHPNLVCKIISIFNSKEMNKKNAQLIFNTHDTNLLNAKLFRRDQIWFTEKNKFGEAKLYSLEDFKCIRKEEAFEENYIRGKYGAIPFLDSFDSFKKLLQHENEEQKA